MPDVRRPTLVPLAIKGFSAAHPDVQLRLEEAVTRDLLDRLPMRVLLHVLAEQHRFECDARVPLA